MTPRSYSVRILIELSAYKTMMMMMTAIVPKPRPISIPRLPRPDVSFRTRLYCNYVGRICQDGRPSNPPGPPRRDLVTPSPEMWGETQRPGEARKGRALADEPRQLRQDCLFRIGSFFGSRRPHPQLQ